MDVAVLPVDLLRFKIENDLENFAPEYAYDQDPSVFVGNLFDIVICGDFVNEWQIIEKLTQLLYRYGDDVAEDDCSALVKASLRTVESHVSRYLHHRVRSWHWYGRNRNSILIISGD